MIIMVAWRCAQHSPILGQAASSHTVTSAVLAQDPPRLADTARDAAGTRTRIQSGLRSTGVSGLWAFSGCRGAAIVDDRDHAGSYARREV